MHVPAAYCTILIIWATTPLTLNWSNETLTPEAAITLRMVLAAGLGRRFDKNPAAFQFHTAFIR